jgi:hypothetical protein
VAGDPETTSDSAPESAASVAAPPPRWESLVWPQWLPLQSRLPLIAQIAGALALIAAVSMPQWTVVSDAPTPAASPTPAATVTEPVPATPPRPAHLNLDVRHSFGSVDLSVSIDGEQVLDTKLAGSRRRFGVVGKRGERSYTKTLDLAAGARVVRVRVRSAEDDFDQSRIEQFDLAPATVATMRIAADKSGLSVVADRPAATAPTIVASTTAAPATAAATAPLAEPRRPAESSGVAEASALAELYQTLRSTLIAMAGFIASAATGFLVESYLRSRRAFAFAQQAAAQEATIAERRRRRAEKQRGSPDIPAGAAG